MAELRELFEMTTKQMEPDQDSWRKQEERHHRDARRKKWGALAVAATIAVVAAVGIVWTLDGDDGADGTTPATTSPAEDLAFGTYLLSLGSGELTPIDDIDPGSDPDVSANGTRIAFELFDVHVANIDGSQVQRFDTVSGLYTDDEGSNAPRWSPDGRTLVYQVDGRNEKIGNLFALDVASGEVTQLTDLEQISSHLWYMSPSYSPDGRSILFTSPQGPCTSCTPSTGNVYRQVWHLWSIPSSGGVPEIVVRDAGFGEYSPDGSTIAYTQISGNSEAGELRVDFGELWVANADGSDPRRLATGEFSFPRWSPDGTMIAVADDRGAIYVVDVDTGVTTKIADAFGRPEWVDDDTLLLPIE